MKTTFGLPKRREQVIELLQKAYSDGNLEDEDYERRLTEAMQAKSVERLQEVIEDFPDAPQLIPPKREAREEGPAESPAKRAGDKLATASNRLLKAAARRFPAILSNRDLALRGSISRPLRLQTILGEQKVRLQDVQIGGEELLIRTECILGETVLDLRSESLRGKQVLLQMHVLLGEVKILLPGGVQIHNELVPIMGEIQHKPLAPRLNLLQKLVRQPQRTPQPHIPFYIILRGNVVMGNVGILQE